jgi:beta-1,2-mannobiose phosphorylase / 1,2-beta-oligomannan phosphorylase
LGNIITIKIPAIFQEVEEEKLRPKILKRFHGNPILEPRGMHDSWEGEGTFNPAVVEDDEGIIHILYRALGRDGISRVGYAQSKDGMSIENRSSFPVFQPSSDYGLPDSEKVTGPIRYNPAMYTSGGSWGGSEDPRAVRIDDKIYMTYTAFEGWNSVRIALTSINIEDFKAGRWHWKQPKLISPPGKVNKNWLLFPEKVKGKFAMLHSITPKVAVEYIEDLDTFEDYIHSSRKDGPQPGKGKSWENLVRGGGPPPLKTDLGWLLLYHAHDKKDHSKYRLGAMILDKDDPQVILLRSAHPILSPDMHYENNGKPGVSTHLERLSETVICMCIMVVLIVWYAWLRHPSKICLSTLSREMRVTII